MIGGREPGRRESQPDQVDVGADLQQLVRWAVGRIRIVRAEQQQQGPPHHPRVGRDLRHRRQQPERQRVLLEAAEQPDRLLGEGGKRDRRARRHQQQRVVPELAPRPAARRQDEQPDDRDHGHRRGRRDEGEPVGHLDPGQQRAYARRDVPALWRAVKQQQQEQDRHRGAGVVRVLEEHLGAAGDARRDHDGACQQGANDAGPPGGTAAGEERGQQHGQRVGDRPGDVHDIRPQPAKRHHEHVLGKFGRVEGDVGGPPATQQQVAVQHRLGLQDIGGAVGVERPDPRLAEVEGEQAEADEQQAAGPQQPRPPGRGDPPRPARLGRRLVFTRRYSPCDALTHLMYQPPLLTAPPHPRSQLAD